MEPLFVAVRRGIDTRPHTAHPSTVEKKASRARAAASGASIAIAGQEDDDAHEEADDDDGDHPEPDGDAQPAKRCLAHAEGGPAAPADDERGESETGAFI